jgi:hypothetical protein
MFAKFSASKLVTIVASVISFAALWAFIAGLGWSGGSANQAAAGLPPAAPLPNAPAPAPADPPVIVQQTTVVRRIHVSDGGAPAGAPSAPTTADVPRPAAAAPPSAPAPAAPPPPRAAAPQPARAAPAPLPVTTTRGS